MATNRSKSAPKRETRTPVTFETAAQLCPHQGVADNVAQAFGLIVPEYEAGLPSIPKALANCHPQMNFEGVKTPVCHSKPFIWR